MSAAKTVFVTGASGFIAKHIVLKLLNAGYHVTGSVRSLDRAAEIRDAVTPHLNDAGDLETRLGFAVLDLTSDQGWDAALSGADALIHTASPFPMVQPDDEEQVIRPAVDGALRALRAARSAGIGRVVMTSSSVAIAGTDLPVGRDAYREDDWTDVTRVGTTPYAKSKTLAEQAAWDFVQNQAPQIALTVINPVFVLGPPLDDNYGTSIGVVERLLRARDPMLPRIGFPTVDVRDVAEMHLRALTNEASIGKRIIAVDRFIWFHEMAKVLKAAYPDRRIVTRQAPNFAVRILAVFDKAVRSVVPTLGQRHEVSGARAREVMGMEFIDAGDAVRAAAAVLIDDGVV